MTCGAGRFNPILNSTQLNLADVLFWIVFCFSWRKSQLDVHSLFVFLDHPIRCCLICLWCAVLTPLHERMTKKSTSDPTPVPMPLVVDSPTGRLELRSDPDQASSTEYYRASGIYTDTADEDELKSSDEDYQNREQCHELEAASTC